ncbi:hypothetical protein K3495_g9878 [Podosphaera aphanis]|nr:hypothetical protein K3495_g9878 [Podosphaera aphanis]
MPVRDHDLNETAHRPTITFLCANVGKGGPSNDIILQSAWEASTDVLFIQEPWASRCDNNWLLKSHPGFKKYSPNTGGADTPRPRSIIYTRKGRDTQQNFICGTFSDFVAVKIDGVTFISIYRAPGVPLPPLLAWNPDRPTVIGGDFNSVHPEWQPLAECSHGDGYTLVQWMLDNGMTLSSSPGVPTHTRSNTLDLVWSHAGAIADVAPELRSTSDHMTLAGDVPRPNARGAAAIRLNSPIRVSDDALEDFTKVVAEWSKDIGRQELQTASDLDNLGNDLVEILSDAIKATGRRSSPQPGQSAPWWTEECREAKGLYRTLNDDDSRKAFRRTVKKAKRQLLGSVRVSAIREIFKENYPSLLTRCLACLSALGFSGVVSFEVCIYQGEGFAVMALHAKSSVFLTLIIYYQYHLYPHRHLLPTYFRYHLSPL